MNVAAVPCLVGPTGSGKSDVGLVAARWTHGEIVCCDAYTVYRDMPILTAAPVVPADVPHHLLGILAPEETYDAARFIEDCDREVAAIRERSHTPWIVGGTALYLRCWLKGLAPTAPRDEAYRSELRAVFEREGPQALHDRLRRADPERAAELHPNDRRRVVRALEIIRATGRPASAQRLQWDGPDRVPAVVVGLRRTPEALEARIAARTAVMFAAGLLEEGKALLARDLSAEAGKVLGLAELRRLAAGEIDRKEASESIVRRTRRFARKQMTFFASFAGLRWVDVEEGESAEDLAARVLDAASLTP